MLTEIMTMGSLLTFFRGVGADIKRRVAEEYGLPDEVALSWLRSFNGARNTCARHCRFWNRTLGYAPKLPHPKSSRSGTVHRKSGRIGLELSFSCVGTRFA